MALGSPQWMYSSGSDYELEQSLRFNDDDLSYLSRTPTSAGNRQAGTFSAWVKVGNLGKSRQEIFRGGTTWENATQIAFGAGGIIWFNQTDSGNYTTSLKTNALYRDTSAWLHINIKWNTDSSAETNRVKIYVNGEQVTSLAETNYPAELSNTHFSSTTLHTVGMGVNADVNNNVDGYLAEVHYIDGTNLNPDYFGETGKYGEWKPIEYEGSYGTNGFYLPFKQDYTVEGFSTVTYSGQSGDQYIGGVGFQSDLTWIKQRNGDGDHVLTDSVRGVTKDLHSNTTAAEATTAEGLQAFNTDGFTLGDNDGNYNRTTRTYVAWNWDMGGSNATNTNGTITSTVRANPTYGQSIVSYNGTGANATVGHGLSSAPEMMFIKGRENSHPFNVYHKDLGNTYFLLLNSDLAVGAAATNRWNSTTPDSTKFSLGWSANVNESTKGMIAYCFHSVAGYSKVGSYTGSGSSGKVITTGFKPAFVMLKHSNAQDDWYIFDNTRSPTNPVLAFLKPNSSNAEGNIANGINFTDTGFTILDTGSGRNASGGEYIYAAFADKREYAYWLDQSGNNNDWTSNNLTESNVMVDSPTNNFCTWNPVSTQQSMIGTLSEGNLRYNPNGATMPEPSGMKGTLAVNSGKWYFEVGRIDTGNGYHTSISGFVNGVKKSFKLYSGNYFYSPEIDGGYDTIGSTSPGTDGEISGCAFDLENNKIWFAVNGTWTQSGNPATNTGGFALTAGLTEVSIYTEHPNGSYTGDDIHNFGQDSSFAGNKTAQGKQDGNDIGDFYYEPPNGFLALCSKNLPDVAVVPSKHFNTVLYTGNYNTNAITGIGFKPDWLWIKERSSTSDHSLHDAVRGSTKIVKSSTAAAEITRTESVTAFNNDGFTLGENNGVNENSETYVAWNWKANGSGASNTTGSINTTKTSANVDAGFSIITYSGNNTAGATIGHGLSKAPEMVIIKSRTNANDWWDTYHKDLGASNALHMNDTMAVADRSYFHDTHPSSSVIYLGSDRSSNGPSETFVAYAFHSVDGYSKVGSYVANGNEDGAFVYLGFRPAFLLRKKSSGTGYWIIQDNKRPGYNTSRNNSLPTNQNVLYANTSGDEVYNNEVSFLSNGFKANATDAFGNTNGETIIYIAFAETPFKNSNAR